ncbi:MAG TPA: RDD family protein, partial [Thermoanaerobaculia bacterium]|nr:RDD family protein [Thermoanaerobaculia bacterium]
YINKTVFMFSKVPRRIRNHLAPTAARLQFLSRGLAGTSWGAALYSLSKRYAPDEVRAVACTPSGVVAVTSADRSRDSYYIAAVVAHYLVQPWEYCPAPVNPGYDTPDAYNRDHLASTGSRSVATLLDSAIILVLFAILTWPKTPSLTGVKVVGYISVLAFAYYWLFEGLAGATLGKLICAIEVRSSSSWKVGGMRSSAVRNLLRVVDAIGFYGVGFAISQASPLRQRLGDRLAGTVVVGRRRSIGLLLALCTFIACLTASGVNAVFQVLSHGHHVTIGSNDEVYYSGSSTKSAAMALGSALKANGFFRDKGSKVFLSRDHSETVLSLVAKDDDWIEADVAFFYDRFGLQAAASIGGLPMKVRLLDSTLETRKVVSAGKVTLGTRDGVYYFGAAREDDAKALGGALRAAGFFSGKGKEVVLLKGKLRTILFPVAEGDWDNFENILFFEALTRKVAPSVGGLPVDVRLVNASFETKKVWTVQ